MCSVVEPAQQITNRRHDAKLHSLTDNILAAPRGGSKSLEERDRCRRYGLRIAESWVGVAGFEPTASSSRTTPPAGSAMRTTLETFEVPPQNVDSVGDIAARTALLWTSCGPSSKGEERPAPGQPTRWSYQRPPYRKPGQTSKRDLNRSRPTVMLLAWVYSWMASAPCSRPIPLIL
jgi:hypothetical protein